MWETVWLLFGFFSEVPMVTTNMPVLGSGVVGREWLQGEPGRRVLSWHLGCGLDFIARHEEAPEVPFARQQGLQTPG